MLDVLDERQCEELKHVKAWLISGTDHWKDKTVFDPKQRCFLSQGKPKSYHKHNLVSLNSLRCFSGGHVTFDVTGPRKMNCKMGQG